MSKQQPAKTPTVAIARILRGLGLKQGTDFRVKGQYQGRGADRERIGTYVAVMTKEADQAVADNADHIEQLAAETGNTFRVSIHFTAGGRMWTWVANYGQRTRDTAPVATADRDGAPLDTSSRQRATELGLKVATTAGTDQRAADRQPVIKAKLGAPRPAFEQAAADADAHPYNGLVQKQFGALTWACKEAGQVWFFQNTRNSPIYTLRVYKGRARMVGWYLTGHGVDRDGVWMGPTVTLAATAAEDTILAHRAIADGMEAAGRDWSKGTRVSGLDGQGVQRTGTVNGVDVGMVVEPGHDNYGRTFVGVDWDAPDRPELGYKVRNRPFTDSLTRI